jgi:hypothetical protein
MADEALITLTRPQFEQLMEEKGLDETVRGVLEIANERLGLETPLTLETLQDGSNPFLDRLPRYNQTPADQRKISSEEILTLFTNVQDYGKFDQQLTDAEETADQPMFSPETTAKLTGAGRAVPETVGAGIGFRTGLGAVSLALRSGAAFVPPAGPPGLIVKGGLYALGGIAGMLSGMELASQAEDAVLGEADPVIPSLEPDYRFGETGVLVASLVTSPWKLTTTVPKAKTGAIEFLDVFSNVARGKYASVADEAFQLAAKNAGISEKGAQKLFEQAQKARAAGTAGPMFSKTGVGVNLGLTKFNPAGFLADPRKGPLSARIVGGVEGGIGKSYEWARNNPGKFLGIEGLSGLGAAGGAYLAQDVAPYSEGARFVGELGGSFAVPLPVQIAVDAGPDAYRAVSRTLKEWWGGDKTKEGLLRGKMEKDVGKRVMEALRRSEEYADTINAEGGIEISADEKLAKFIEELGKASEDAGGLTVADLAAREGLDFSATLRTIQSELAKSSADLQTATGKGREEMQAGAIAAIRALTATGDPLALTYAARLQQGLFEQNILDNMEGAVATLTQSAAQVLGRQPGTESTRTDLSLALYDTLKRQIDQSKVREGRLWNEVGSFPITEFYSRNGRKINQPNVLQLLDRPSLKGGLNMSSKGAQKELDAALGPFKADIDDFRDYFQNGQGRNPFTAERVWNIRSGILNRAAALRSPGKKDLQNAGRLDKIADALLRDLTSQKDGASEAYNAARAYTFARNNVFTRSFLGKLQETNKDRGYNLAPEFLLDEVFKGQNNAVVKRFSDMENAGKFLVEQGAISPEDLAQMDTTGIMNAALRDSLAKIMDRKAIADPTTPGEVIETFVVNPKKLSDWKQQPGTEQLLTIFPKIGEDLADVQTAQNAFDNMLTDISLKLKPSEAAKRGFDEEQLKSMYGTQAFNWVLQYEDPGKAVAKALASERPTMALNALYRMVDEADYKNAEFTKDQALQGLKSAIFQNALTKANNTSGLPSGDVLQRELFTQMKGVDPSVKFTMKDFLLRKGLATEDEMENVEKAVKDIRGVQEAFATGDFENVLFKKPSLAKLFYARIAGATAGGAVQNKLKSLFGLPQMSGGLIAEQTGSDLVQRVLLRGPETQRIKIMTEMFSNAKFMSEMLKDIQSKEQADKALTRIEKFVAPMARQVGRRIPIGTTYIRDEERETTVPTQPLPRLEPVPVPTPPAQPNLPPNTQRGNLVPPAPAPTTGGGAMPSPNQQAAAAPQGPPSSSGPVDRARFAALFPEDRELLGIGSLMGQ